jgi:RNA polymerase sigma factor (sigma-70 family)
MNTNTVGLFLRHLALSEEVSRLATVSDHDLLVAYEVERGQAAFTELMRRHGPMVLRTCRRLLGRGPDAEDAFQATFVLLARQAAQLRREAAGRRSLGGWLHRVAYRTAANVLRRAIRRRVYERQASVMTQPDPDPSAEATWNEVRPILDAELDALPDESRRLLIACYFQGKTHAEAATELGLPLGSIARRLEKARALLGERLIQRGIAVSVPLLAVLLEESAKGAGVPAVLLVHTVEAARTFTEQANGLVSDHVAQLVRGGLKMAKGSAHLNMALVGWMGLLGAGLIACQTLKAWPERAPEHEAPAAERSRQGEREQTRTDRFGDPLPPGALVRLGTVRLRHMTGMHSLAFTRDGKGLITAGQRDPARLWDTATGRMLRQFGDNRDDQLLTAVLSPDGRTLAGRVPAGDLCLWDVATGTLLRRIKAGRLGMAAKVPLAFSPDGKTVASRDGMTLRLWEVATGKELWAADRLQVAALAYSADGKALIWTGYRGDLHLWDAATGKELRQWNDEKKRAISALAPAPDGNLLTIYGALPGATGGLARLWDTTTGKEVWRLADEEGSITTAAFSPDGKILATGHNHGPIRLGDAATGRELRRCAGRASARCLAFSPDGKTLASGSGGEPGGSGDQMVHLWDVKSGREVRRAGDGHEGTVCSLAFTPDGKDVVSGGWEGSLRVWESATGEQRQRIAPIGEEHFVGGMTASVTSAVSPDGKTLVSATFERIESKYSVKVRRWDRETARELRGWSREVGNWMPHSLVFSPDGKTVACMVMRGNPDQIYLWETATGKELSPIAGGYPAFSPDGKLLATAPLLLKKDGQSFTLWDAATGKEVCSVKAPGRVYRLLFSPDGRMLATLSNAVAIKPVAATNAAGFGQSVIHLWPLLRDESGKSVARVGPPRLLAEGKRETFAAWAFSPDGRTLALAGADGAVRLLETAGGKECGRFAGHGGNVEALSFAPDGLRLASGSRDTTILVWDVTGRLQDGRLRRAQLSDKELEKCWADLAADDAGRARRAIWALAAAPSQTVPYLAEHLRTSAADVKARMAKLPQLLRDLDDDAFAVREKAKVELARLGEAAEPALRQALAKSPSAETRRSLEQFLKALEANRQAPFGEPLREARAVEVLEHIGSREAREALKNLKAGTEAESSLTQEVRAALERLDRAERR